MSYINTNTENRVIFFDNLRWIFVLFVIVEHASNAYTNVYWWPVTEKYNSIIAGWLSAFSDAFAMPLLFYIAGYFAIPTIEKKGAVPFLKGKLKRLGIPWLVCILTICPILPLIYHFTKNELTLSTSYWELWVVLFKNAADFKIGLIVSMNDLMTNNQFYQRYMWFLSLLILFFIIFSLLHSLKKEWFGRSDKQIPPNDPSISSALKFLFGVGFLTTLFSFLMIGLIMAFGPKSSTPEPLFTFGNVLQFRPSRIFFFIIYFGLGLMTFRNRWIERGKFPGHFKAWTISFISLLIMYLFIHSQLHYGPDHLKDMYGAIFFFVLNFLTIATLGIFTSIGLRYWNKPRVFGRRMAGNSYDMYLSHYIFVLVFQLLLFTLPGVPVFLKFCLVSALSIISAYIVSQYFIKPFPRIAILATAIMLIAMLLLIRP